jgi:hypothetical protein
MFRNQGYDVRLDLSELEFIDSSGLPELIIAVAEPQSDGWRLDIDPQITAPVRRSLDIAGLTSYLCPGVSAARTSPKHSASADQPSGATTPRSFDGRTTPNRSRAKEVRATTTSPDRSACRFGPSCR